MKRSRVLGAWYALLTVAILTPIVLTVTCGSGDPATVWSALAVMTGSMALIALVFTLVAVARVRYLTNHLGIDGAMGIHRTLGVATVGLATAHILAVVADNPANVWLLDPSIAPGRAVAGNRRQQRCEVEPIRKLRHALLQTTRSTLEADRIE